MDLQLQGLHHLTAITAAASENVRFYTQVLGLRLIKKTVNQDDTSAYHLFYGDGVASPGADITFFDWPAAPERRGSHSVSRTALRVPAGSLGWWQEWLRGKGVRVGEVVIIRERACLPLEDGEGQRLLLVEDVGQAQAWARSPVPPEHQIIGLGPITLTVPALAPTELMLTHVMNMRPAGEYRLADAPDVPVHVFEMGPGGAAAELHVAVDASAPAAVQGAGGVHHVAFRTPDYTSLAAWAQRVREFRIPSSGEVERYYFRSLYFREPNGVLFEIATDIPGFTADEPLEALGERLALPPFLEPRRREIEANLKPL